MPTYGYECDKCGNKFDLFQKMTDEALGDCPKCKAKATRLISGGSGIIFKGTGFYETDYKKKKTDDKPSAKPPECPNAGSCGGCAAGKGN